MVNHCHDSNDEQQQQQQQEQQERHQELQQQRNSCCCDDIVDRMINQRRSMSRKTNKSLYHNHNRHHHHQQQYSYHCVPLFIILFVILLSTNAQNHDTKQTTTTTMECPNNDNGDTSSSCQSGGTSSTNVNTNDDEMIECGMYMAVSSIPHSGWGMFTTKPIAAGERIYYGDLVIQTEDPDLNMRLREYYNRKHSNQYNLYSSDVQYEKNYNKKLQYKEWVLYNYYWNPTVTLGEYEADSVQSIIPGLGMLANSHTGLVNAIIQKPKLSYLLHRKHNPGAGAVTNYHDVHFVAKDTIEIGSELFVEYGDSWFEDRDEELGIIPLSTDFKNADGIIQKFVQDFMQDEKEEKPETPLSPNTLQKILDLVLFTMNITENKRLYTALPHHQTEIKDVIQYGTSALSVPNRSIQTIEWLRTNGQCLDHIRPGPVIETIQQPNVIGYGAYATRTLPIGTIVAPVPLIHLHRKHMEIYGADDIKQFHKDIGEVWPEDNSRQQLMNYVYGHRDSTLLLFPYSPVVNYINHGNDTVANVKLRWSTLPDHLHKNREWFDRTPNDLIWEEDHAGLVMELVATRSIQPDEEILLNYGPDFEKSWNEYINQKWEKPVPTKDEDNDDDDEEEEDRNDYYYVSAIELNEKNPILLTKHEQNELLQKYDTKKLRIQHHDVLYNTEISPIRTACFVKSELQRFYHTNHQRKIASQNNNNNNNTHISVPIDEDYVPYTEYDEQTVSKYKYKWVYETDLFSSGSTRYRCEILHRYIPTNQTTTIESGQEQVQHDGSITTTDQLNQEENNKYLYTVILKRDDLQRIIFDVPRTSIHFIDQEYTSDVTYRKGFRHEIHIPDDLFPKKWMDLLVVVDVDDEAEKE